MSDLIRREDVMALWEKYHPYIATKAIEFGNALKEIPSAVPIPHGRLIDGDALMKEMAQYQKQTYTPMEDACGFAWEAPTVIEAEVNHE